LQRRSKNRGTGSDDGDVLCLRAFFALSDVELYFLAFGQCFKSRTVDRAEVDEYVRATFLSDETETFGFVEPLDVAGADRQVGAWLVYRGSSAEKRWNGLWRNGRSTAGGTSDLLSIIHASYS
jgi:hypothetical protein